MFVADMLRPVPAAPAAAPAPVTAGPLEVLTYAPGAYVAESLAAALAAAGRFDDAVWLRSHGRDTDTLEHDLARACRSRWHGDGSPGPVGLRDVLADAPADAVIVWEAGGRLGLGARRLLSGSRRALARRGATLVAVTERRTLLPPRARPDAPAGDLSPTARDRLRDLAGHRQAVLHDVAAAALRWDPATVERAIAAAGSWPELLRELTAALLPRCTPDQLDGLRTALRTGYWHGDEGASLRPWTVPLEGGWHWLRPIWEPALRDRIALVGPGRPPATVVLPAGHHLAVPQRARVAVRAPVMQVRLLGDLSVQVAGRPVPAWCGRRGPSILRYLLSRRDRRCSRGELLATFWPDVEPDLARNRLQVAVSGLRKAFSTVTRVNVIEFADGGYRINPDLVVEVDVDRFEAALSAARRAASQDAEYAALAAAVAGYGGDFAADAPDETWSLLPREALRLAYVDALDRLSAIDLEHDRPDRCIITAQRMLQLDPCREDAHRLLMRCYLRQGNHYRAERQYAFCRQVLRATLDVEPSAATEELFRAIRVGSQR